MFVSHLSSFSEMLVHVLVTNFRIDCLFFFDDLSELFYILRK